MDGIFEEAALAVSVDTTEREAYLVNKGREEIRFWKRRFITLFLCGIMLFICLFLNIGTKNQEEDRAYQISSIITLSEDILFLKYQQIPETVGLEEIRHEWISNPCYDTALSYAEALDKVLEYLDAQGTEAQPMQTQEPEFIEL